jgi:cell division protease FtsH
MPPETESPRRRDEPPPPWKVEGAPKKEEKKPGPLGMPRPPGGRRFLYFVAALLALNFIFASLVPNQPDRIEVPYTQFLDQVDKNNVEKVFAKGDSLQGNFKTAVDPQESGHKPEKKFTTFRPAFAPSNDELLQELRQKGVDVTAKALDSGRSFIGDLLLFFGPTLLLVGLFFFLARRSAGMAPAGWAASAARGPSAMTPTRPPTARRSPTSPASTRPRTSSRRSSTS